MHQATITNIFLVKCKYDLMNYKLLMGNGGKRKNFKPGGNLKDMELGDEIRLMKKTTLKIENYNYVLSDEQN